MQARTNLFAGVAMLVFMPIATAFADLKQLDVITGNVGLSIDAIGGNDMPVGDLIAEIPAGATIAQAYLYAAGTPIPWYDDSPQTVEDYNGAGIVLGGTPITNFSGIVGAIADRIEIGQWYTGRADVTDVVSDLVSAAPEADVHNWSYEEGRALTERIDGAVLVVAYEEPSLPEGSVVLYDGGQRTGGELTTVNFAEPIGDPMSPDFALDMSLAISFSITNDQRSLVDINGVRLTSAAGNNDDGLLDFDGALITAGGVGDSNENPVDPFGEVVATDDELYDLRTFLSEGDTSFEIFTTNESNDDNIFFLGVYTTAEVVPEPSSISSLILLGLAMLVVRRRSR